MSTILVLNITNFVYMELLISIKYRSFQRFDTALHTVIKISCQKAKVSFFFSFTACIPFDGKFSQQEQCTLKFFSTFS